MATTKAIYELSKEIGIDTNRILLACKTLQISAKASSKKLNKNQIDMISEYFQNGKNVANETIELNNNQEKHKDETLQESQNKNDNSNFYFPNRLIS